MGSISARPFRAAFALLFSAICASSFPGTAGAVTATGRLQIIHLDVGQGDGAVLISPLGQVVMIDDGVSGNPTPASGIKVPQQLQALGVTQVDHHFASHYHADHIGLFGTIFGAGGVATLGYAWDRGESYTTSTYTTYASTAGSRRRTLVKNQIITLDSLSAHPVTIKVVDLDGAGTGTTDENGQSLVLKVSYGAFDAVFAGDLPGGTPNVETIAGPEVGPVEMYKVNHHGSATSSTTAWLNAIQAKVAVISCGTGNPYGHPTSSALSRMHTAGVKTYWTETGQGVAPNPTWDKVSNNQVVLSVTWEAGGVDTIRGTGFADTFTNSGAPADGTPPVVTLNAPNGGEAWGANSVQNITWNATDNVAVTSISLYYSTTGTAGPFSLIASGEANDGTYAWTLPGGVASNAYVRVVAYDAASNLGIDISDAAFGIAAAPVAAFAGSPTSGSVPLTVQFTDESTNSPTSWSWDFGDGGASNLQNPSHLYETAGTYTVTLTASNAGGADPEVKTSYVTVATDPADVTAGGAPSFALSGIQPNPVYGEFGVAFSLRDASPARIELIDLGGRRVVEREVGSFGAGPHLVRLDGSRLPAGLYFVRLTQAGRSLITRATILR